LELFDFGRDQHGPLKVSPGTVRGSREIPGPLRDGLHIGVVKIFI
jgi:hypothetical protein